MTRSPTCYNILNQATDPMTLETELLNAWQDATADLTPEEREVLAQGTAEDWTRAIAELIRDPGFWQGIGTAFLEGMARGLSR